MVHTLQPCTVETICPAWHQVWIRKKTACINYCWFLHIEQKSFQQAKCWHPWPWLFLSTTSLGILPSGSRGKGCSQTNDMSLNRMSLLHSVKLDVIRSNLAVLHCPCQPSFRTPKETFPLSLVSNILIEDYKTIVGDFGHVHVWKCGYSGRLYSQEVGTHQKTGQSGTEDRTLGSLGSITNRDIVT